MEVAFNEVSFRKWLRRTYNDDGTPKTPNPDVSQIGKTIEVVCAKCEYKQILSRAEPWTGPWTCSKCRGYRK